MTTKEKPRVVCSIAGLDPSAGAGVLADIKTISAFGCYGVAVVTSLTIQNTLEVSAGYPQTAGIVGAQLEALFDDFDIAAVKTGLLPSAAVIEETARIMRERSVVNLVIDPVLRSSSGYAFVDDDALNAMTGLLFPLASVVTPSVQEAERLSGSRVVDEASMARAGERVLSIGACAVLITGGDLPGESATDLLLDSGGFAFFRAQRLDSTNTHGTGCALSSALACLLAEGTPLREAVSAAKDYVRDSIKRAPGLGRGNGPLGHLHPQERD